MMNAENLQLRLHIVYIAVEAIINHLLYDYPSIHLPSTLHVYAIDELNSH